MGPDTDAPPPGSLTVPPLHGWVVLLVLLGLVIVVAVCFLLVGAGTPSDSRSSEWEAWLQGRSRRRREDAGEPMTPGTARAAAPSGGTGGPMGPRRFR